MYRTYIALAFVPVLVAVSVAWYFAHPAQSLPSREATRSDVIIGGQVVHVDIAATEASRALGLGGRDGLAPDSGMLFVFAQDGDYAFWMKDMLFSIDILWIDSQGHVVTISPTVSPSTYPSTFAPTAPARYVLELPAGYAAGHRITEGESVTWSDGTPLSLHFAK